MKHPAQDGFTLIEVMVALLVFGMIAAAGVALLATSVRGQAAGAAKLDDLSAIERTMAAMTADCLQAQDRPTRATGGALLPAFAGEGGAGTTPMLRLVRGGWSDLDGAPRPTLQKVEYRVAGGALERVAYPQLDGAPPLAPAVLLPHVRAVALRYRYAGAWTGRWDGAGPAALPDAIELTVVRDDRTALRALFLVGTGYRPRGTGRAPA